MGMDSQIPGLNETYLVEVTVSRHRRVVIERHEGLLLGPAESRYGDALFHADRHRTSFD